MFSIIIPLYNKSLYIEKCLSSVRDQTFHDFEVIIVNDGSTDDGPARVNQLIQNYNKSTHDEEEKGRWGERERGRTIQSFGFLKPPLGVPIFPDSYRDGMGLKNDEQETKGPVPEIKLLNQSNSGVSTARNNGAKAAKYDYIAFLDADDWWDNHFLEEMKVLIEQCPEAGLYGSDYYYVKNEINRLEDKGLPKYFKSGYIDYIKLYGSTFCVPINCSFVVVPKMAFYKTGGFNHALKFGEDFDLWIRLALNYKVAYVNKPLAYSNQDAEINQRAVGNKNLYFPGNHFIFNLGYLDAEEKNNPDLKLLLDGLRVRALQQYRLSGKYPEEVKSLLKKVDFSKQSSYYRFFYKSPKFIIKLYFSIRTIGSKVKQYLLKKIR